MIEEEIEARAKECPKFAPWTAQSEEGPLWGPKGDTGKKTHSVCAGTGFLAEVNHACVATAIGATPAEARAVARLIALAHPDGMLALARCVELLRDIKDRDVHTHDCDTNVTDAHGRHGRFTCNCGISEIRQALRTLDEAYENL